MSLTFPWLRCRALVPLVTLPGLACDAATLRVPSEYATIQQAIDAARTGDTVLVASGAYVEVLEIHDKGDLNLESEAGAESTTIDAGGGYHAIALLQNDYDARTTYRVAGFTIRNGMYAGIVAVGGRVDIENNILTGNGAGSIEGAINLNEISGSIRHNDILGNKYRGIQMANARHLVVEGNRIEGNDDVGLLLNGAYEEHSSVKVVRNVIRGNADYEAYIIGPLHVEAADNLIVHVPTRGNLTVNFLAYDRVKGNFVNNTIGSTAWDHGVVSFRGDVGGLQFANNIIYSGSGGPVLNCLTSPEEGGVPQLHHIDAFSTGGQAIEGYCADAFAKGKGNVSVDPGFATDEGGSKWKLRFGSPLIDAGGNDAVGNLRRDIRGAPRIVDGGHGQVVDMGAFEHLPE